MSIICCNGFSISRMSKTNLKYVIMVKMPECYVLQVKYVLPYRVTGRSMDSGSLNPSTRPSRVHECYWGRWTVLAKPTYNPILQLLVICVWSRSWEEDCWLMPIGMSNKDTSIVYFQNVNCEVHHIFANTACYKFIFWTWFINSKTKVIFWSHILNDAPIRLSIVCWSRQM